MVQVQPAESAGLVNLLEMHYRQFEDHFGIAGDSPGTASLHCISPTAVQHLALDIRSANCTCFEEPALVRCGTRKYKSSAIVTVEIAQYAALYV
jgi:hypothetical protein